MKTDPLPQVNIIIIIYYYFMLIENNMTGMKLADVLRETEDREGWRDLVVWASVVPLQSSRLRDR